MARSTLLLFSICAASSLLAQQDTAVNDEVAMLKIAPCDIDSMPTDRVSVLESKMQDVLTGTTLGDFGARAASARPQINSNRLYFSADLLIWKAFFGGSDYAVADSSSATDIMVGDTKKADFRWREGFRLEAGYHLPHDSWDALANYTYFRDKADDAATSPVGGTIVPLILSFTNFSTDATASIRWNLFYQNFDLALRRPYFLSRHFSVAPYFGLRNTWIDHGYHTHYTTLTLDENADTTTYDVHSHQDFWGIGPVAGIGSEWHMSSQWRIFSSLSGAILSADYDIHSKVITNGLTTTFDISANTRRMSPVVQGALGFGWHMNFNCNRNHIAANFCYEGQYFWKQNLMPDYASTTYQIARMGEDLGMHGFTFDVLFDF